MTALANRRLQPLGHLTADCKYTYIGTCAKRFGQGTTVFRSATSANSARNLDIFDCSSAFISPHCIEEIANDSASQSPESRVVQEIVQCFAGLFWAHLPASIAEASRSG